MLIVRITLVLVMIAGFVVLSMTISSGVNDGFSDADMIIIRISGLVTGFALMANCAFAILGAITKTRDKNIKK